MTTGPEDVRARSQETFAAWLTEALTDDGWGEAETEGRVRDVVRTVSDTPAARAHFINGFYAGRQAREEPADG